MPEGSPENAQLAYATPVPRPPARTFAAAMLMISGLVLILFGGCFLIGVWMTIEHANFNGVTNPSQPLTSGEIVFLSILAVLALASFTGAILLLMMGARGLLRVTRS